MCQRHRARAVKVLLGGEQNGVRMLPDRGVSVVSGRSEGPASVRKSRFNMSATAAAFAGSKFAMPDMPDTTKEAEMVIWKRLTDSSGNSLDMGETRY
jgi:hypothetical protein